MTEPTHFRFMDLPRELRDEVYNWLVPAAPMPLRDYNNSLLTLSTTCKQLHLECTSRYVRVCKHQLLVLFGRSKGGACSLRYEGNNELNRPLSFHPPKYVRSIQISAPMGLFNLNALHVPEKAGELGLSILQCLAALFDVRFSRFPNADVRFWIDMKIKNHRDNDTFLSRLFIQDMRIEQQPYEFSEERSEQDIRQLLRRSVLYQRNILRSLYRAWRGDSLDPFLETPLVIKSGLILVLSQTGGEFMEKSQFDAMTTVGKHSEGSPVE